MKVGDRVFVQYWQRRYHRDGEPLVEHVITKVGRKWAEIKEPSRVDRDYHMRFDMQTLRIDGGSFSEPGRVYLSREVWEEEQERMNLRRQIRAAMDTDISNVPLDALRDFATVLEFWGGKKPQ